MFIQPCNFRCTYCFAVFNDLNGKYLTKEENLQLCSILSQKFNKITFLGGEPTLIPYLKDLLQIAKSYGCTTSIITNGYRLNDENYIKSFIGLLDWITISIDSSYPEIHAQLGRGYGSRKKSSESAVIPLSNEHYYEAAKLIKKYGFKFKISTVVNQLNKDEGMSFFLFLILLLLVLVSLSPTTYLFLSPLYCMFFSLHIFYSVDMSEFIYQLKPLRWKIFQCLYLEGENSGRVEHLLISKNELEAFIARHEHLTTLPEPIALYSSNEDTKNGYACITPAGCFLDDIDNKHRYSRPILSVGVDEAWKDIDYRPENFRARGGYYEWQNSVPKSSSCSTDIEDLCSNGSNITNLSSRRPSKAHHSSKSIDRNQQQGSPEVKAALTITHTCPPADLHSFPNIYFSLTLGTIIGGIFLQSFC